MKTHIAITTLILLLLINLLSACTGGATVASSWPGLTADEETAYIAFNNHIYAVQLSNGVQRWRYPNEPDNKITFYAEPELSEDGQLIVGSYSNGLYSLNPENGNLNWEFAEANNRFIGGALSVSGSIYAPNADKKLFALTSEGVLRWVFATDDENWARPAFNNKHESIYIASMDHSVYSINPENGKVNWRTEDLGGAIVGSPVVSEVGILYVGTFGNELLAIDIEDGSVVWRVSTQGWVWSSPALQENRLYLGDLAGYFYAIDAANGAKLWERTPTDLNGPIAGTPLVFEDNIYVATESGAFHALNTQGDPKWMQTVDGKLFTSPIAAGGLILVASTNPENLLAAFTPDGARKWTFSPEK